MQKNSTGLSCFWSKSLSYFFASNLNAPLNIFPLLERYLCLKCGFSDGTGHVWLMLIYFYISMPRLCKPLIPNARTDEHDFTNAKIAESVISIHIGWFFLFWNWSQNYCWYILLRGPPTWRSGDYVGKKLLNMKRKVFTSLIPGDGILSFNEIRVGLGRFIIISLKLKGNRNHLKQWKLLAAQIKRIGTQRGLKSPTNFVKLWDVFEGQYFYLCPVSILVFFTNKIFIKN